MTGRPSRSRFAISGSLIVALLFATVSLGGLLTPTAYARETANWTSQAIAQDWFDLVVAAPALALAAWWASRGSRRGQLVLAGLLLFAIYTLVIYAFAVHLNALFLIYCAGLGVALYALIAVARETSQDDATAWVQARVPRRAAGGFLIFVGLAFGVLWLLQLVPAAITGEVPPELAETGLVTNPVHVIDLSFILPLHVLAGVQLWRRRPIGLPLAPVVLAFSAVMAASIAFLMVMLELRGIASGTAPVIAVIALISLSSAALLVWMLRALRA